MKQLLSEEYAAVDFLDTKVGSILADATGPIVEKLRGGEGRVPAK
jgi:hypothetical protein